MQATAKFNIVKDFGRKDTRNGGETTAEIHPKTDRNQVELKRKRRHTERSLSRVKKSIFIILQTGFSRDESL